MKNQLIVFIVIGIVVGGVITWAMVVVVAHTNNSDLMRIIGLPTNTNTQKIMNDTDMTMGQMTISLQNKKSDDFDRAFLQEMVIHHQGAVDMAHLADTNAKHDEIKRMANDILTEQTEEINQMKVWQTEWGYAAALLNKHDMMHTNH